MGWAQRAYSETPSGRLHDLSAGTPPAALPPPTTDHRSRNAALSFCRAARMAREIACASLPAGRCTSAALAARPTLAFAVFGGSATVLDRAVEHFTTPVALTGLGTTRCGCQHFAADVYGPLVASCVSFAACPTAPDRLFECEDARRVELDVWLDVDPQVPSNTCRAQASPLIAYDGGDLSAAPWARWLAATPACSGARAGG